ncbi:glycosyltransferase [Amycolatopsis arida]|uniref:glycosyltransferase n=1 Tax=Amycolatopsis arida TaxID=587909 RepID=UPI0010648EE7|nr:glycosyltransferase [Amycolatopsis arida]TDX84954.1 glycosyl transferase family 2 [Amycolatopsis arida]
MPTISVVTAVIAGREDYLGEAYDSLRSQSLPDGWTWQWVVQEDGETGEPAARLAAAHDDPRVVFGSGRHGRAATARTLALAQVTGELVRTLDADDLLTEGALYRDVATMVAHPELGWCVSPAVDLLPDGATVPGPRDPKPGPLPPGVLAAGQELGELPVVGTTLCARTELVRALGGWQALPADEDVALMLAAEAVAPGWMLSEPGLIYRKWPGQSTADTGHLHPAEKAARRRAMLDRVRALRATEWRWSPRPVDAASA